MLIGILIGLAVLIYLCIGVVLCVMCTPGVKVSKWMLLLQFLIIPFWPFILLFLDLFAHRSYMNPKKSIKKECTRDQPFSEERKENEVWTHADAYPLDEEGRFFECPHCGTIINLGSDIV